MMFKGDYKRKLADLKFRQEMGEMKKATAIRQIEEADSDIALITSYLEKKAKNQNEA